MKNISQFSTVNKWLTIKTREHSYLQVAAQCVLYNNMFVLHIIIAIALFP